MPVGPSARRPVPLGHHLESADHPRQPRCGLSICVPFERVCCAPKAQGSGVGAGSFAEMGHEGEALRTGVVSL